MKTKQQRTQQFDTMKQTFDHIYRFPYHTIEADPVRNTVVFRHDDSTFYSVEELLAMQVSVDNL